MNEELPFSGLITPTDIEDLYNAVIDYGTEANIHVTKMAIMLKILGEKLIFEHDIKIQIFERSEHLQ